MFLHDEGMDKVKKVADEVIESVGETIKRGKLSSVEYNEAINAFANLLVVRANLD